MKAHNYGRIVNISSVAGKEGNPKLSAYSAAKAGVIGLTKSLGKELASYDIAVNAITPATAKTRILDTLTEEFIQYMLTRIPRGRFLEVDEAAAMVAWLVSRENSFTTASVFACRVAGELTDHDLVRKPVPIPDQVRTGFFGVMV